MFGVGIDRNIVVAYLKAVLSGVNRALPPAMKLGMVLLPQGNLSAAYFGGRQN